MLSPDIAPQEGPLRATIAHRVLDEGAQPLLAAAREAGLRGNALPSLKTFLRAVVSGKLDAVKVGGRWLTSASAVRRYVEQLQQRRPSVPPIDKSDAVATGARSAVADNGVHETHKRPGALE